MAKHAGETEEVGPFQLTVLVLSIVALFTMAVDSTVQLPRELAKLLQVIDSSICVVLLIDFGVRFQRAPAKLAFMKWGWIDLVASIPMIEILRLGRLVRILRILRLIRSFRLIHSVTHAFFREKIKGGFSAASLTAFLLLSFSSVSILICERHDPGANIKTAGDAIWWSVATVTTVGYGDRYPVTTEGRLVASVLMLGGLGLFGTISALTAAALVGRPEGEVTNDALAREIKELRTEVALLRADPPSSPATDAAPQGKN